MENFQEEVAPQLAQQLQGLHQEIVELGAILNYIDGNIIGILNYLGF